MEKLTIKIPPPITEHCKHCDYEDSYSFSMYNCDCPKCGKRLKHGARQKKEKAIKVSASNASYDYFMNPNKEQWQYEFCHVPPENKRFSFVVNDELDYSDPCNLAAELKIVIDNYLYNSDKDRIAELVHLICNDEEEEKQCRLRVLEKKEKLERELYELYYHNDF